jgi:hypothetical protein
MLSEKKLQRKAKWDAFVKDNLQKVAEVLIKHDPVGLVFKDDNSKVENPDEYDGEAEELLNHINLYGGIKDITKEVLHNLLHSCFCEMFCSCMDLRDGSFSLRSMEDLEKTIINPNVKPLSIIGFFLSFEFNNFITVKLL